MASAWGYFPEVELSGSRMGRFVAVFVHAVRSRAFPGKGRCRIAIGKSVPGIGLCKRSVRSFCCRACDSVRRLRLPCDIGRVCFRYGPAIRSRTCSAYLWAGINLWNASLRKRPSRVFWAVSVYHACRRVRAFTGFSRDYGYGSLDGGCGYRRPFRRTWRFGGIDVQTPGRDQRLRKNNARTRRYAGQVGQFYNEHTVYLYLPLFVRLTL